MANKKPTHKEMIDARKQRRLEAELKAKSEKKKQTIRTVFIALGTVLLLALIVVLVMQPWSGNSNNGSETTWEFSHDMETKHHVEIAVKDFGVIKV